jgi:hypothetical protein
MTDQQEPVEAERPPEQASAPEQPDESPPEQTAEQPRQSSGSPRPPSGWADLDAYCEQLRAEHADWAERLDAIETQLLSLRATLAGIATQYHTLGIEEDLALINERILGGVGVAQSVRVGHDLERYVALIWPASGDPRPAMAQAGDEAEYRVEAWLHLGPDGKGRIRIEGEKRLEATLPTSRERVRSVLMRAIQAPKLVRPGDRPVETAAEPAATASPPPQHEEREPVEAASPRPGDPEQHPPPDEQVIPLGPAEDAASAPAGEEGAQQA